MPSMEALATEGMALMDEFGICDRCNKTEFVDDLLTVGDWLLCEDCYEDL